MKTEEDKKSLRFAWEGIGTGIFLILVGTFQAAMNIGSPAVNTTSISCGLLVAATAGYLRQFLLKRIEQRHRKKYGLCLGCGYDMCATPAQCPECGTVPQKRPQPIN